ncbi:hypothetical protein SCMC78_31780 [Streptomyces sp. CMC78]|uniref:Secreted protein n=1 Tax=Streptomyces sp. CMC78 TaxID=3231512 RepID=A0AB33KFE8_9ACTN
MVPVPVSAALELPAPGSRMLILEPSTAAALMAPSAVAGVVTPLCPSRLMSAVPVVRSTTVATLSAVEEPESAAAGAIVSTRAPAVPAAMMAAPR